MNGLAVSPVTNFKNTGQGFGNISDFRKVANDRTRQKDKTLSNNATADIDKTCIFDDDDIALRSVKAKAIKDDATSQESQRRNLLNQTEVIKKNANPLFTPAPLGLDDPLEIHKKMQEEVANAKREKQKI